MTPEIARDLLALLERGSFHVSLAEMARTLQLAKELYAVVNQPAPKSDPTDE